MPDEDAAQSEFSFSATCGGSFPQREEAFYQKI